MRALQQTTKRNAKLYFMYVEFGENCENTRIKVLQHFYPKIHTYQTTTYVFCILSTHKNMIDC